MKKYMALFVLGVSILLLSATSIAYADDGTDNVTLSNSPNVTVSLSNNTSINVSYSEIFVSTSNGVVGAVFAEQSWNITNSSGNFLYRSSFDLKPISGSDLSDTYRKIMNLSDQVSVGGDSTPAIPVSVVVQISHYNGSVSMLSLRNTTNQVNGSIYNINTSTLKLSFGLYFNLTQQIIGNGSVTVVLVQAIKGSNSNNSFDAKEVDAYENSSDLGNGVALLNNSLSDLRAVYWWNNNYTYNGNNASDYALLIPGDSSTSIAFVFKTNASIGQYSLYQDPYLSVNGANLATGNIQVVTQIVVNFLLQHVEFFGAGIAVGSVTLALLYSVYRKDRIKL